VDRPTPYPEDKHRPTDNPLYYKVSYPNRFSPPIETEGEINYPCRLFSVRVTMTGSGIGFYRFSFQCFKPFEF